MNNVTQFHTKFAHLLKEWLTNRGKQANKTFKRWNGKAKRNTGFEDRAGNFSGNKIGN